MQDCTYDTNMKQCVTKKKSNKKIAVVIDFIDAVYLLEQDIIFNNRGWEMQY